VYAFGDATFDGSYETTYGSSSSSKIVGITASPDGGYSLLSESGGVYAYGSAGFYSSPAATGASSDDVAIQYTSDGKGYWVLQSDGGVLAFGDALGVADSVSYPVGGAGNFSGDAAVGIAAQV
jgi:hypothetical protein